MKATLTFDLDDPGDRQAHEDAVNGSKWKGVVQDIGIWLRNKDKYGGHEWAAEARGEFFAFVADAGLSLD